MPAPDSPIWLLVLAVQGVLQGITTAGGYRTDVGTAIATEAYQERASAAPRGLIVIQAVDTAPLANKLRGRTVSLVIEVTIAATAENAKQIACSALDDLIDAIPDARKFTLATGITADVAPGAGRILDRPEGIDVVTAQLLLVAKMRERLA